MAASFDCADFIWPLLHFKTFTLHPCPWSTCIKSGPTPCLAKFFSLSLLPPYILSVKCLHVLLLWWWKTQVFLWWMMMMWMSGFHDRWLAGTITLVWLLAWSGPLGGLCSLLHQPFSHFGFLIVQTQMWDPEMLTPQMLSRNQIFVLFIPMYRKTTLYKSVFSCGSIFLNRSKEKKCISLLKIMHILMVRENWESVLLFFCSYMACKLLSRMVNAY